MSESDGLKKLTEYLQQTRRQAETAIDCLNVRVSELQNENDLLNQMIEKLEMEREQFKNQVEQLKMENSTKWRLQERDDWKSLVDSVQKDRGRLQEHCSSIELELEHYKEENMTLRNQIDSYESEKSQASHQLSLSTPERSKPASFAEEDTTDEAMSPLNSPIFDRMGNEMLFTSETPRAVSKTLKSELKKAHAQLENERRQAEEDKLLQRVEITRLQEELSTLRPLVSASGAASATLSSNKNESSQSSAGSSAASRPQVLVVASGDSVASSWFNPLGGLLGLLFQGSAPLPPAHKPRGLDPSMKNPFLV